MARVLEYTPRKWSPVLVSGVNHASKFPLALMIPSLVQGLEDFSDSGNDFSDSERRYK